MPPGVSEAEVHGVYRDPVEGAVWYGCGRSLCKLANGGVQVFGGSAGVPQDKWSALLRDRGGRLWARGEHNLILLRAGAKRFEAGPAGLPDATNTYPTLMADREGELL